ncbi:MAG: HEPN domain-containing protein [Muribaculaceae bacterium]|nr:HEPN domain-containing protein [Muribaculaceae bacterium]
MNKEEKINYWVELADYDFDTALWMMQGSRYLYVGFMLHQVVEKMLKAYWSKVLEEPPLKIHTLTVLASRTGLLEEMSEEQQDLLTRLLPLNIEARYPRYKERIMQSLTSEYCSDLIQETSNLVRWIKQKL